ncbi:hypothetical protein CFR76_15140 [Komagataeibacter swingsii]|uniref:Uncharacterized protein n=1 Tax=Komagataeibacter swingsii TaxID=215220 RepID=A0A2V4R8A2_9PROT|nr:hypothetical protein CFR76_15140 [Komagataeibacter swingsii]GBQ58715.1 hypothetical protein AA16373_1346 [Komagataeibacter swingsii DSM 16373]
MANRAYSTPRHTWACSRLGTSVLGSLFPKAGKDPLLTSEHLAAGLIVPALLLLALVGFAQPEVLRHGAAEPHPAMIALAEVIR